MKSNITKEYHEYLKSPEWREFRKKAFAHYGKKCLKCTATKTLQIHHLHYNNIFHELIEDVIVVCKKHHEQIHGIKPIKKNIKLTRGQKKRLRKKKDRDLHLSGNRVKLRGSHKQHFNKKVKGDHALKLNHPVLDKIAEIKRLREGRNRP